MRSAHRRNRDGGFTLVELAIVVTIVGVLAMVAVVGYRKYVTHSKIGEAHAVIGAIRIAQEDHKAERGTYLDIGETFCPSTTPNLSVKSAWVGTCSGSTATWEGLPLHIDAPVHFGYATSAGVGAFAAPSYATWVNWNSPPAGHWYVVGAKCDMETGGVLTELVASSYTNQIFSRNEGQ